MGAIVGNRQSETAKPIVAFDFDGTLTVRDSFSAFIAWRTPKLRALLGFLRLLPELLRYLLVRDHGRLKAASTAEFLAGLSSDALAREAEAFAEARASRMFRPDALEVWEGWRAKGAMLVIVTASPEQVVAPFAKRLGANRLIGTRLKLDAEGRIAGPLDGLNCRGEEKVRRLSAEFGPDLRLAAAYGDTSGDLQMLGMAETAGYRVFRERP